MRTTWRWFQCGSLRVLKEWIVLRIRRAEVSHNPDSRTPAGRRCVACIPLFSPLGFFCDFWVSDTGIIPVSVGVIDSTEQDGVTGLLVSGFPSGLDCMTVIVFDYRVRYLLLHAVRRVIASQRAIFEAHMLSLPDFQRVHNLSDENSDFSQLYFLQSFLFPHIRELY